MRAHPPSKWDRRPAHRSPSASDDATTSLAPQTTARQMTSEALSRPMRDYHTGFRAANSRHPSWHFARVLAHLEVRAVIMITSTSAALSRSLFQCEDTTHRRGRDSTPGLHRWNTAPPSHWRTAACGRGRYITTASSGHSSPTPPTPMGATHRNLAHSYQPAPRLSSTITSSIRQSATASAWHTDSPTQKASATTSASAHRSKTLKVSFYLIDNTIKKHFLF